MQKFTYPWVGGYCDRCHKKSNTFRGSWFNEQMICPECAKKEENHPDFYKAKAADFEAVAKGNYNFPGIGLPKDLVMGGDCVG